MTINDTDSIFERQTALKTVGKMSMTRSMES